MVFPVNPSFTRLQDEIDRNNQKYHQSTGGKGWYWWVYVIRDGRPTILGSFPTQESANAYVYQHVPNEHSEILCLDTVDLTSAVRKIKSHILETSHSLDEATIRMVRKEVKKAKEKNKSNNAWEIF